VNFATLQTGQFADEDLVQDGWTDIAQRIRDRVVDAVTSATAVSKASRFASDSVRSPLTLRTY
jgi:hypothetical protein